MPDINADTVIYNRHIRTFIQFGGALPGNPVKYAGKDAQLMVIEGVGVPELGGVEPFYVHDPDNVGRYRLIGRKISPPDLASATLKVLEKHGPIPFQLAKRGCQFNLYQPAGKCKDPSDFLFGWSDYVMVYDGALTTDKDLGARTAWSDDNYIEDSLTLRLADVYPIGAVVFGIVGGSQIDREVVDVAYGSKEQCGDCGDDDDGTKRIYGVTAASGAGSPGLPAEVVYTLDGGASIHEATITGLGANATPSFIDVVGNRLIVGVSSETAYYWSTLSDLGVPGAFTKVTSGFVAAKGPTDVFVAGPGEVYFSALGGYIYKSTNITAGVTVLNDGSVTTQDLLRIHGSGETIIAVGKDSDMAVSLNRGASWSTPQASPSSIAADLQALAVLSDKVWWVGTNLGRVVYTRNGGLSWVETTFSGSGSGQIDDIVFANNGTGWFSHRATGPTAVIFATWNGGQDWANDRPRVTNLPTFDKAGRLAVPKSSDLAVSGNNVAVAGLAGDGTDGIFLIGVASRL